MPKQYINTLIIITIILLALAPLSWPYGYYTFLRIITTATFALLTLTYEAAIKIIPPYFIVILGLIVVLYNPIIPIFLPKYVWIILNYATMVTLFVLYYAFYKKSK